MVTAPPTTDDDDPERALAIAYTLPQHRAAFRALLALDDRLAAIVRATREPLVGQMRLTWWHDALTALDRASPPAEPVLRALADHVLPAVSGGALAASIEGWEALLEAELDDEALVTHAERRGTTLFAAMATIAGAPDTDLAGAGRRWALADLSGHLSDPRLRRLAGDLGRDNATDRCKRWPRSLRGAAALALSARMDLEPVARPRGHPKRVLRLLWLRSTGR